MRSSPPGDAEQRRNNPDAETGNDSHHHLRGASQHRVAAAHAVPDKGVAHMTDPRTPILGQIVRWNGYPWKVEQVTDQGIGLRNLMTGERPTWHLGIWMGAWETGELTASRSPAALDKQRPRSGAFMRRAGTVWRIKTVRSGLIHLENVQTDEVAAVSVLDWQGECWEGATETLESPDEVIPESIRALLRIPLESMPTKMREYVEWGAIFAEAYRNPDAFNRKHCADLPPEEHVRPDGRRSKRYLDPFLRRIAKLTGLEKPGASTFCKWLAKLKLTNGDIRAIAPRHDRQGPHERRMSAMVEQ
jgi:hypothetical protein